MESLDTDIVLNDEYDVEETHSIIRTDYFVDNGFSCAPYKTLLANYKFIQRNMSQMSDLN